MASILRIPLQKEGYKIYTVYKITNLINNKSYIGITKREVKIRVREHFYRDADLVYQASLKYGKENFSYEVLEENIAKEDIDNREVYYINKFNSLAPNGYNLSKGGLSNKTISDEGRKKLSDCNLGIKNPRCSKRIFMINKTTGEIERIFGSIREAARALGNENKYRAIAYCLEGKTKSSNGYYWKYEE